MILDQGKLCARCFGYPVFNADQEVDKIYKTNKKVFKRLNKTFPKYFKLFPIKKDEVLKAILANKKNLNKIVKIVHLEVKKNEYFFKKK